MNVQHDALIVFLTIFGVDIVTLIGDAILDKLGYETVSQHVWLNPALGVPIVVWQLAGAAALGVHLWYGIVNLHQGKSWSG